jgi:hypothetical protein
MGPSLFFTSLSPKYRLFLVEMQFLRTGKEQAKALLLTVTDGGLAPRC